MVKGMAAAKRKMPNVLANTHAEEGQKSLIRIPKTAEVVADHIRARIIRGELKDGDFLPAEAQLMETFSISRPTLREAFRILEAERLISVGRGTRTGARVHEPRTESVSRYAGSVLQSQGTTIADIYDARLAIEPFSARRVAERCNPEDVRRLREEASRLADLIDEERYTDFMVAIVNFHKLVVELGGNRTLLFFTALLQDMTARHQAGVLKRAKLDREGEKQRSEWGIRSFRKLIRLVEAGDAAGAESHWQLHLMNSNKVWVPPEEGVRTIDVLS